MKKIYLLLAVLIGFAGVTKAQNDPNAKKILDGVSTKIKGLKGVTANFSYTTKDRKGSLKGSVKGQINIKGQEDYLNAENLFKTYLDNFPNSARAEEIDYMHCYAYYKQSPKVDLDQTATSKTISLMQAFINTHPESSRNKDATQIIDECRRKLELKEFKSAQLYFDLSFYKAAAVAFATLIDDYPDSDKSDEYKLASIKAYYKYAQMSVQEKQEERFAKVISECADFNDRFPGSKLEPEVANYKSLSENNIKNLQNEQIKETSKR